MFKLFVLLLLLLLLGCDYIPSDQLVEKKVHRLDIPKPLGITSLENDSLFYFVNGDSKIFSVGLDFQLKEIYSFPSMYEFQSIYTDGMFVYVITSKNLLLKIGIHTKKILKIVNLNRIILENYQFRTLFFSPFSKSFILVSYGLKTYFFELNPKNFRLITKFKAKKIQFVSGGVQSGNFIYLVGEKSQNIYKVPLNNLGKVAEVRGYNLPNVVGITFNNKIGLVLLSRELRRIFIYQKSF